MEGDGVELHVDGTEGVRDTTVAYVGGDVGERGADVVEVGGGGDERAELAPEPVVGPGLNLAVRGDHLPAELRAVAPYGYVVLELGHLGEITEDYIMCEGTDRSRWRTRISPM